MSICSFIIINENLNEDDWFNFCSDNDLNFDEEKQSLYTNLKALDVEIYYLQHITFLNYLVNLVILLIN